MHPSFHLMNPSAHNALLTRLYILVHQSSIICLFSYLLIHTFTQALSLIQQLFELLICVIILHQPWGHGDVYPLDFSAWELSLQRLLIYSTRNTYCIYCTQRPYIQWLLISLPPHHNLLISFHFLCSLFSSFPPPPLSSFTLFASTQTSGLYYQKIDAKDRWPLRFWNQTSLSWKSASLLTSLRQIWPSVPSSAKWG